MRRDRAVRGESERTGSIKSWQSKQTEVGTNSGTDAEAERIWQNTTEEEENNNRRVVTRAALLGRMETGSITGSTFHNSRKGGDFNFVEKKKCVLKVE